MTESRFDEESRIRPRRARAKLAMTRRKGTAHVEGRSGPQVQEHGTRNQRGLSVVGSHCGFEGLYFSADPLIWHGPCTWKLEEAGKQQLTTPELVVVAPLAREMKEGLPPRLGVQIRPLWGVGSRCIILSRPPTRGYWLLRSDDWASLLLTD